MISSAEETGLREILQDLEEFELYSIFGTITKGLFQYTTNRSDAIDKILSCIKKPIDVLKRQRITKKILFSYLVEKKSSVSPEFSKQELVLKCLEEWKSTGNGDAAVNCENVPSSDIATAEFAWLGIMSLEFSKWFFALYNQLQEFGPQHFWSDCKLRGELKSNYENKQVEVIGSNEVAVFLSSLITTDKFYFDAHTSQESITSEQDQHGLVKIMVGGVVHQLSNCIGLFDCAFGLVRNPAYDNNWKIKWIHVKIHVGSQQNRQVLPPMCQSICQ